MRLSDTIDMLQATRERHEVYVTRGFQQLPHLSTQLRLNAGTRGPHTHQTFAALLSSFSMTRSYSSIPCITLTLARRTKSVCPMALSSPALSASSALPLIIALLNHLTSA